MSPSDLARDMALNDIKGQIATANNLLRGVGRPKGPKRTMYAYEALHEYAVEARYAPTPKGIQPGVKRHCFFNAFTLALDNPELTYMEGFAHYILPIHHAWVVDPEGRAIDNTWEDGHGAAYYGIPFTNDCIVAGAMESGIYSLLFNPKLRYIHKRHIHLATLDKLRAINCTGI